MDAFTEEKVKTLIDKYRRGEVYKHCFEPIRDVTGNLIGHLNRRIIPVVYSEMNPEIIDKAKVSPIIICKPEYTEEALEMCFLVMNEILPIIFPDFKIDVQKKIMGAATNIIINIDLVLLSYSFVIEPRISKSIGNMSDSYGFIYIKDITASENLEYKYYVKKVFEKFHVSDEHQRQIMDLVKPKAKISSAYILDVLQSLHCRLQNLEYSQ